MSWLSISDLNGRGNKMIFYRDMKHYRAPEEPVILKNVVTAIAIIALVILLGYLGEEDHKSKLEQIVSAQQSQKGN